MKIGPKTPLKETAKKIEEIFGAWRDKSVVSAPAATPPKGSSAAPQSDAPPQDIKIQVPVVDGPPPPQVIKQIRVYSNRILKTFSELFYTEAGTKFCGHNDEDWTESGNYVRFTTNKKPSGGSTTVDTLRPWSSQDDDSSPEEAQKRYLDWAGPEAKALYDKLIKNKDVKGLMGAIGNMVPPKSQEHDARFKTPKTNVAAVRFPNYLNAQLVIRLFRDKTKIGLQNFEYDTYGPQFSIFETFDENGNSVGVETRWPSQKEWDELYDQGRCIAALADWLGIDVSKIDQNVALEPGTRIFREKKQ